MSSSQIEFLKSLVVGARNGNRGALDLLRSICTRAVEQAPKEDLLIIAERLVRLGDELTQKEVEKN